jgi:PKD repeat protein
MKNNLLRIAFVFLIGGFIQTSTIFGQVFPIEIIKYSGPPDKFINIVILGDGYTSSQQAKFISDVNSCVDGFLSQQPFKKLKDSINIYAVKVVSNVSGASLNPNSLIDNYFGSSYWSYGIERLLVAWRYGNISTVLNANTPFYDEGVVIVNDSKYGGSGGQYAVFSTHSQSIELFLHEFGHSLSGLADEYWAGIQYAAEKTNMTQNSDPNTIKWKKFLYSNGIGIYSHEESTSWYRPHQSCKMRYLGYNFCDVCNDKITIDIRAMAQPEADEAPIAFFGANELNIDVNANVKFYDLTVNKPHTWSWTFEGGEPETSNDPNPTITYKTAGSFNVTLKATNDRGENTYSKQKYITVKNPQSLNTDDFASSIAIYPNPASSKIGISIDNGIKPTRFKITNSIGNCVIDQNFSSQVDISGLSAGCILFILSIKEI